MTHFGGLTLASDVFSFFDGPTSSADISSGVRDHSSTLSTALFLFPSTNAFAVVVWAIFCFPFRSVCDFTTVVCPTERSSELLSRKRGVTDLTMRAVQTLRESPHTGQKSINATHPKAFVGR